LPAVSLLSKIDLLANYGPLPFSLEFFTECQDLDRLIPYLQQQGNFLSTDQEEEDYDFQIGSSTDSKDFYGGNDYVDDPDYQRARNIKKSSPFFRKHERLHKAMAEVVGDFGLLSFLPLDISSAESVGRVLARIDKCNGYIFTNSNRAAQVQGGSTGTTEDLFQCAVQSEPSSYECIADIQERLSVAREANQNQPRQQF